VLLREAQEAPLPPPEEVRLLRGELLRDQLLRPHLHHVLRPGADLLHAVLRPHLLRPDLLRLLLLREAQEAPLPPQQEV
jgi:hypothetical protein